MRPFHLTIIAIAFLLAVVAEGKILSPHEGRAEGSIGQKSFSAKTPDVSCDEAANNVPKVKAGLKRAEVIALLGMPVAQTRDAWGYDFRACRRPRVGAQVVWGAEVWFDKEVVKEVKLIWVDATGPAPRK